MSRRMLGVIQLAVLGIIRRRPEDAYGSRIGSILSRIGRDIDDGQVFTALKRLEGRGLIAKVDVSADDCQGQGRAPRYYVITKEGLSTLNEAASYLKLAFPTPLDGTPHWRYD